VERERSIESESGQTYTITILDDDGINFTLTLPGGKKVTDNFNDYQDRSNLYQLLEDGVYEFIQETAKSIETEYIKRDGKTIIMTMNNERYELTIDTATGMCKLVYPEREREFYIDNLYLECLDLAVLYDGRLSQYFTEKVKKELGINLPKPPVIPMLKLEPKV